MSVPHGFTSTLEPILTRYFVLKETLGRKYDGERRVCAHLDRFLTTQCRVSPDLNAETFAQWCVTLSHLTPTVRRSRMRIVRNLCLYRQRTEPGCFIPDPGMFPRPHAPRRPYCFSEGDMGQLLYCAKSLDPTSRSPLRAEVYRLALVLLYTAGLRRGELVRLTLADYDVAEHSLRIRGDQVPQDTARALVS